MSVMLVFCLSAILEATYTASDTLLWNLMCMDVK
jgi:hypothetical protein